MPTIKKLTDVLKEQRELYKQKYGEEQKIKDEKNINRSKFYNSHLWKNTRNNYIQEHPLCELCYIRGITRPAEQIHHAIKFHDQYNDQIRWKLLTDKDNLMALCSDCHNHIHKKQILISPEQKQYIVQRKDYVSSKYLQQGIIINYTNDLNT